jgi:hypothetical protein
VNGITKLQRSVLQAMYAGGLLQVSTTEYYGATGYVRAQVGSKRVAQGTFLSLVKRDLIEPYGKDGNVTYYRLTTEGTRRIEVAA